MAISTPASSFWLDDDTFTFTPTGGGVQVAYGFVGGTPRIYDTGDPLSLWSGVATFKASVLDKTTGDETYTLVIQGSNSSTFASGVQDLGSRSIGVTGLQEVIALQNSYSDVLYRYLRLKIIVNGTTPSIKLLSFIKPLSDITDYSYEEQITLWAITAQNWNNATTNFRAFITGVAGGGPNGDGKYPLNDGLGNTVLVTCPAQMEANSQGTSPLFWGAIADGTSHPASEFYSTLEELQVKYPFATSLNQEMDWLGVQAALKSKKPLTSDTKWYKMCNSNPDTWKPITSISGENYAAFNSSIWDFFDLRQNLPSEHLPNYQFTTSANWSNATIYSGFSLVNAVFGSGKASMVDPFGPGNTTGAPYGQNPFYQWGQYKLLSPGSYRINLRIKGTLGGSYNNGNGNSPGFSVGFFTGSPGDGGNPFNAWIFGSYDYGSLTAATPEERNYSTTFKVNSTTGAWLTFSGYGYANYEVYELDITPVILNCALHMTRDGALEHYPLPSKFGGMLIYGPGYPYYTGLAGVFYGSYGQTDGNHTNMFDFKTAGWEDGIRFGNGAYLIEFHGADVIGNENGLHFPSGLQNAGENIKFYGGAIHSNGAGIRNPGGAGFTLYGTAMDYFGLNGGDVNQTGSAIIANTGRIDLVGVHMETRQVNIPGRRMIMNTTGWVTFHGGLILLAPPIAGSIEPIIHNQFSTSAVRFNNTMLYNTGNSGTGALADGAGQILGTWVSQGNPNFGLLVSEAPFMDRLGGAGSFEDIPSYESGHLPSEWGEIGIDGGVWVYGRDSHQYNQWENLYLEARTSTEASKGASGTKGLQVRKLANPGGDSMDFMMMVPVNQMGQQVFTRFQERFYGPKTYANPNPIVFSTTYKSSAIVLSNGNRTAELPSATLDPIPVGTSLAANQSANPTANFVNNDYWWLDATTIGNVDTFVRTSNPLVGKVYIEFRVNAINYNTNANGSMRFGLTNQDSISHVSSWGSVGYSSPIKSNGINIGSFLTSSDYLHGFFGPRKDWVVNDTICMAVDVSAGTVKFRLNKGEWTPEIEHGLGTNIYPVIGLRAAGDKVSINAGYYDMWYTPPIGYRPYEQNATVEPVVTGATYQIYRRWFWGAVKGRDKFNRPVFARTTSFKGESNYNAPWEGDSWKQLTPNSPFEPPESDVLKGKGNGAPAWATHFVIIYGLVNMGRRTMAIDDFIANVF